MTAVPLERAATGQSVQNATTADCSVARGQLVPLRTKAELQARDETVDVYVVEVPLKDTGKVLSILKQIPGQSTIDLHHLRRVVKHGYEPASLLDARAAQAQVARTNTAETVLREDASDRSDQGEQETASKPAASQSTNGIATLRSEHSTSRPAVGETVHILLAPTSLVSPTDLLARLQATLPALFRDPTSTSISTSSGSPGWPPTSTRPLLTLHAPLHPPPTPSHAAVQSAALWPTVYNPNTVYGPNPAIVAAAQAEIEPSAARYLGLARYAGWLAKRCERSEGVGVVVVERSSHGENDGDAGDGDGGVAGKPQRGGERIVAVAGDGRYAAAQAPTLSADEARSGRAQKHANPANHAVMRAIEAVASKRRRQLARQAKPDQTSTLNLDQGSHPRTSASINVSILDELTALEDKYNYPVTNLKPHGYLCLNLEVYVSHEPCLMCCMALVHSRVGRVVFARRMPRTGGLSAEVSSTPNSRVEEGDALGRDGEGKAEGAGTQPEDKVVHENGRERSGLGYGLFWREELNWRFLCWEWQDDDTGAEGRPSPELDSNMHA